MPNASSSSGQKKRVAKIDNPAGRLHAAIRQAMAKKPVDTAPMSEVLAGLYDGDPNDPIAMFLIWASLLENLTLARRGIESIPNINHALFLKPLERLEELLFKSSPHTQWVNFRTKLESGTMDLLEHTSDRLAETNPEPTIDLSALDKVKDNVAALIKSVLASDLPGELKAVVVDRLQNVINAITYYQLHGSRGLMRATDALIGVYVREHEDLEKAPSVRSQFYDLITSLVEISKKAALEKIAEWGIDSFLQLPPPA